MTSQDGSVMITTPDATPSYNLSSLVDGEAYTISVSGVNLVGEGAQCASVTATPLGLAGPPTDLVINYDPDAPNSASPWISISGFEFRRSIRYWWNCNH